MRRIWIDCKERIPCNPCQYACPVGAIEIGADITGLPAAHPDRCTGCGRCVAACPGQACFLVDPEFSPDEATVDFPYEYLPLPTPGLEVEARSNEGETLCAGRVLRVHTAPSNGQTAVVRIAVPRRFAYHVRGIRPLGR